MQQAEQLKNKRVYKEAEQLYSRVNDIVSSFSPANGPMVDVINRKYFVCNASHSLESLSCTTYPIVSMMWLRRSIA